MLINPMWLALAALAITVTAYILGSHSGEGTERMRWYVFMSLPELPNEVWDQRKYQDFALGILHHGWPEIGDPNEDS